MIDRLLSVFSPPPQGGAKTGVDTQPRHKVLRMVTNDRTAGAMPKWEAAASAQQEIEENLALAQTAGNAAPPGNASAFNQIVPTTPEQEFGFADLIDMINPLQHIPIVNNLYRGLTHDEIKPAGRIIGGALFGGPAGFVGGLANVILEKETGRDITGNAMALITRGEMPKLVHNAPTADLPGTVISFANLSYAETPAPHAYYSGESKRSMWGND